MPPMPQAQRMYAGLFLPKRTMNRNMHRWLEELKATKVKKAMPILSFPCVQLMEITVKDLISNSDNQAKGLKLIADRVNSAAAVSLMDLSLEAECFGAEIRVSDDEVPTVVGNIVTDTESANALTIPPIGAGRTSIYLEAAGKAVKLINDRPVFAGVIGPFSLAGRLVDVSEAMIFCYEEPEMMHTVLSKVTEFLVGYVKEYKKTGVNGIIIAEPVTGVLNISAIKRISAAMPISQGLLKSPRKNMYGFYATMTSMIFPAGMKWKKALKKARTRWLYPITWSLRKISPAC